MATCGQFKNLKSTISILIIHIFTKGMIGLDLRWKYDVKLFLAKKLVSDWLTLLVNQWEASFLAGNSLTSYFHFKSKHTTPLSIFFFIDSMLIFLEIQNLNLFGWKILGIWMPQAVDGLIGSSIFSSKMVLHTYMFSQIFLKTQWNNNFFPRHCFFF